MCFFELIIVIRFAQYALVDFLRHLSLTPLLKNYPGAENNQEFVEMLIKQLTVINNKSGEYVLNHEHILFNII